MKLIQPYDNTRFELTAYRIRQMLDMGLHLDLVVARLEKEDIPGDIIFFAYVAAKILNKEP